MLHRPSRRRPGTPQIQDVRNLVDAPAAQNLREGETDGAPQRAPPVPVPAPLRRNEAILDACANSRLTECC